jgi:undecaprenyl diphosphate synthase
MRSNKLKHIAIIMDGNGRWAKLNNKTRIEGHRKGVASVKRIIQKSIELKIGHISLYAFSNDNWKRPKIEINGLMGLFLQTIEKEFDAFVKNDIKVSFIGDFSRFPTALRKLIDKTTQDTYNNCTLNLNIAIGYSGRIEILNSTKKVINEVLSGKLDINDVTESVISEHLYNRDMPDPDLLIRTGSEHRLSDFMLWQIAYSEIFFIKKYWPDFNEQDFLNVISNFKNRERRYGKISEQIK